MTNKLKPIDPNFFIPVKEPRLRIDNTKLVEDFRLKGGKILHVHSDMPDGRGMTLAFIAKSGRVEVATSVQHRNDSFTKKIGTKLAIEHFIAGKTINLPIIGRKVTRRLQETFSNMV